MPVAGRGADRYRLSTKQRTLFLTTRARNKGGGNPCLFGHGISTEVYG